MSVILSKRAELFYRALDDICSAEHLCQVSPNNAAWHCAQSVEKAMKGALRCYHIEYDYVHSLKDILNCFDDNKEIRFSEKVEKEILFRLEIL